MSPFPPHGSDLLPCDSVRDLDRQLSTAWSALTEARARFSDVPCGEAVTDCEAAESTLNGLLDARLALTRDRPVASRAGTAAG